MAKAKYNDSKVFQKITDDYFLACDRDNKTPTKQGYALALDIRYDAMKDYLEGNNVSIPEEDKKNISLTIKKSYDKIETKLLERLMSNNSNVAGTIFYLKNAFHYRDRQDLDVSSKGEKVDSITYVVPDVTKPKRRDSTMDLVDNRPSKPDIQATS